MHTSNKNVHLLFFFNMVLKVFSQQDTRRKSALFQVGQILNPYHIPLQNGIRFFRHLNLATPSSVPYGSPAWIRRRYEVPTFHINDPMNDLGVPWTPVVPQSRASTLETCNLSTYYSHRGIVFDLLNLSRPVLLNDAYGHSNVFTISFVPSP